ncbi:sugar ABC transporter ATP-binding protein [Paenalkalicoccus suaedae]|uniref:Autoinducer 2 import ATP-binding protein LsrA n=1 Tax=Paenalkalicoccus suaedae TaxID=2592382 RepID=A0A859F9N4_9BACI|nr:sugar ABC transporter ATP-binding protein [Paenalkalicoccus suaedae]QKS69883.1 sugar ABC transporter ATP-binding protein [Paenalkalicoccus suaedae]
MKDISLSFPGVKALQEATFKAKAGEIHALIGANGAGKSTMMNVLAGVHQKDSGTITIAGEKVDTGSPKKAQRQGIQLVHQEVDTALFPALTVAENVLSGQLIAQKRLTVGWGSLHKKAKEVLSELNVAIPTKKLVQDLTLAEKQMVLLARAIATDCRILILDEPTAPLSNTETEALFRVVKDLKQRGMLIIFISHRLKELLDHCDAITVMRDGKDVLERTTVGLTTDVIVEAMLGKKLEAQFAGASAKRRIGQELLRTQDLSDGGLIKNVSITLSGGEIVGLAGLVGAGKTELCKVLFGASRATSGTLTIQGKKATLNSPYDAVKRGLALVPEERRKEGIFVDETVACNITATSLSSFTRLASFLAPARENKKAGEIVQQLGIKTANIHTKVRTLSGGNQQKIAIGKWMVDDADVYIFDEPTKGVDVGAKQDIYELITGLAERGKAVLFASCELPEVIGIADRIYVMYDGTITREVTSTTTEEELLQLATGGA